MRNVIASAHPQNLTIDDLGIGHIELSSSLSYTIIMVASRNLLLVMAVFFSVSGDTGLARSHDPDVPDRDPRGYWRQMTLDDATSTSKCVGSLNTPICAVETVMACFARHQNALCRIATEGRLHFERFEKPVDVGFTRLIYRFVWAQKLSEMAIEELPRYSGSVRPHDLRIDVLDKKCEMRRDVEDCGLPPSFPIVFIVRRSVGRWIVVDWETADWRLMRINPTEPYVYRGPKRK